MSIEPKARINLAGIRQSSKFGISELKIGQILKSEIEIFGDSMTLNGALPIIGDYSLQVEDETIILSIEDTTNAEKKALFEIEKKICEKLGFYFLRISEPEVTYYHLFNSNRLQSTIRRGSMILFICWMLQKGSQRSFLIQIFS